MKEQGSKILALFAPLDARKSEARGKNQYRLRAIL